MSMKWNVSEINLKDFKQVCVYEEEPVRGRAVCHMYFENEITQEEIYKATIISVAPEMLEMLEIAKGRFEYFGDIVSIREINDILNKIYK